MKLEDTDNYGTDVNSLDWNANFEQMKMNKFSIWLGSKWYHGPIFAFVFGLVLVSLIIGYVCLSIGSFDIFIW